MLNLTSPIDPAGRELSGAAWKPSRTLKISNFQRFFVIRHCFFIDFLCFLLLFAAVDGLGSCGYDPDVVGKGSCYCCYYFSVFFFKQKTAYEIRLSLVGSEMCIRDSLHIV